MSEDAYWVVTVDRHTGDTATTLVEDADKAHAMARIYSTDFVYATVVGKR
jgi:hypothetical protein